MEDEFETKKINLQATTIHIRIQLDQSRRPRTMIEGLPSHLNHQKIVQSFRKKLSCGGNVIDDLEKGPVIRLLGDRRRNVVDFLINEGIGNTSKVLIYGF